MNPKAIPAVLRSLRAKALLGAAALALGSLAQAAQEPNFVVIIADDFGVDLVNAYGESLNPPCTPNLDQLASDGILFRNAYATPTCLSTRAALMTGRFGFRSGIGAVGGSSLFSDQEITIAEALTPYEAHAIGKWHLNGNDPLNALDQGFDRFVGFNGGGIGSSYYSWTRYDNGVSNQETEYSTTVITDDAIDSLGAMQEPWLLYVAYNAPHSPLEAPPSGLCPPASQCPNRTCDNLGGNPDNPSLTRAMTEAMDTEIGRLLDAVALEDPNAYVIFLGDNGTAKNSAQPPFVVAHGKGEVYDGGVNVPFMVKGPGVAQGESGGLISVVDIFSTLVELADPNGTHGLVNTGTDSVSLVPYFNNPALSLRTALYAETFQANNTPAPWPQHEQAVRGDRYKLIRRATSGEEFFDLQTDLFEGNDLLGNLNPAQQAAYDQLSMQMDTIFEQPPVTYCTAGTSSNGCRASLYAIGNPSATDDAGFLLSVQGTDGTRPGLFYFGASGRQAQSWGNGTSYQCVVPPVTRTRILSGTGSQGNCDGAPYLDLNAEWCPTCPAASKNPGAGSLLQAQFWYRDPASTSNVTSSMSNAIEFPVAP